MANAPKLLIPNGFLGNIEYNPVAVGGAANANQVPLLNSSGLLDLTMIPSVAGISVVTSAALTANSLVNIYNNAGTLNARPADNSLGYAANGFVSAAFASGATATVYTTGNLIGQTTLTPGTVYGLGTAGAVTATAPSTPGYLIESVGIAYSTTAIAIQFGTVTTAA